MEAIPKRARGEVAWQWSRTADTQRALLDAARAIFVEQGFTEASIAQIVERAGSSVGSLYHHFGGKSELFIALWQEHQIAQQRAANEAVARAKAVGVTDPAELFEAGTRAVLDGCWVRRDLVALFFAGDGPPGFEVMRRQRTSDWIGQNDMLLGLSDSTFDELYVRVLTSMIGECSRFVMLAKSRRQANQIIEASIGYVRRLTADGPWAPSREPVKTSAVENVVTASARRRTRAAG
ncbi:TetR/AcrR family transcriptional regulator [Nocardia sp. CA-120079]|uniref:TetR/AcrR family transcriptional regulator n=1 Tax=Nocardia sp. CA-120079 TaxID=3239974 RepID=UPI003D961F6A